MRPAPSPCPRVPVPWPRSRRAPEAPSRGSRSPGRPGGGGARGVPGQEARARGHLRPSGSGPRGAAASGPGLQVIHTPGASWGRLHRRSHLKQRKAESGAECQGDGGTPASAAGDPLLCAFSPAAVIKQTQFCTDTGLLPVSQGLLWARRHGSRVG